MGGVLTRALLLRLKYILLNGILFSFIRRFIMFENLKDKKNKIHYTRYIMSWIREGGDCNDLDWFAEWLASLELDKEDISEIRFIMSNGKMELESSARKFLANRK